MKKIILKIQEPSINKMVGNEFEIPLHEKANLIDVINEVDKIIRSKGGP